jgi:putative flippase GtrA
MTATPPLHWNIRLRTLGRSWIVGGLATVPHLLGLIILVELFGVEKRLANPPALIIGLTIQFFGNKYFAFEDHSPRLLHQGSWFLLVEIGAFLLNMGIYDWLVATWSVNFIVAMLVGTFVVYQGFSYPLWGYIFKKTVIDPTNAPANPAEKNGRPPAEIAPHTAKVTAPTDPPASSLQDAGAAPNTGEGR